MSGADDIVRQFTGDADSSWSTSEERNALRKRLRVESQPLPMTAREVVVLQHLLTMAETALAGASVRDLPE